MTSTTAKYAILAMCMATCLARAGDYTNAVDKQRRCETHGNLGVEFFNTGKIFGKTTKQHVKETHTGKLPKEALDDFVMISIVASKSYVSTAKDAYMAAWAECMDNH